MQKFYTTTLECKFIKYLLSVTPLPLVSYIQDNDVMINNNYYLYGNNILKCTQTGLFRPDRADVYDYLTVSNLLCCRDGDLVVTDKTMLNGGVTLATYTIASDYTFGQHINGMTETFLSTTGYYDSETHRKLGDYLRLIKYTQGVDLMSLYNCFCNKYVEDVDLSSGYLEDSHNSRYKVTLVPVKFNKTYTIAIDSSTPIYIKPIIYKNGLLKDTTNCYIYDNELNPVSKINYSSYRNPFTYRVFNYEEEPQKYENSLYLAIQIPKNNQSLITVLEGTYDNHNYEKVFDNLMYTNSNIETINNILTSAPSLLTKTQQSQYTYSDKLISYLLENTIDDREMVGENVERVYNSLGIHHNFKGMWDVSLRGELYRRYMRLGKTRDELNYYDILGYVDSDIENAINKGFIT